MYNMRRREELGKGFAGGGRMSGEEAASVRTAVGRGDRGGSVGFARALGIGIAIVTMLALAAPVRADEAREAALERELLDMKRRLEALEQKAAESPLRTAEPPAPAATGGVPQAVTGTGASGGEGGAANGEDARISPPWAREELETAPALRGVYDKPFLVSAWNRAFLGGYTELEYHGFDDPNLGLPRGFRAHRTNLFLFADVADRVRFGSEIEFENEAPGEDLEVAVEMAFIDWIVYEELTLRGGVILTPLGRINVNHDGPVRDLTDRPMVSTFVIPTTLSEPGVGLTGKIRLGGAGLLTYEAYCVNGFQLLDRDGNMAAPFTQRERLLRDGRTSQGGDFHPTPAWAGRVGVLLLDAFTLGGSWHVGKYDQRSDNLLSIVAADLAVSYGPFALEGELAWAGFERDGFARTAGIPDVYWGGYGQVSFGGMPEALRELAPAFFAGDGARLTAVLRFDHVDLDGDRAQALEPGVVFRPFADTALKMSYRFGFQGLGIRDGPGRESISDDGIAFSFTTYF